MLRACFFAVRPDGGIPALPEMIVDLADTAGTGLAPLAFVGLKGAGSRLSGRSFRFCLCGFPSNSLVDLCRCGPLHLIRNVGVDVQCGATGHMTDDCGERLHIHTMFQGGGGKGMTQIMEADVLALSTL